MTYMIYIHQLKKCQMVVFPIPIRYHYIPHYIPYNLHLQGIWLAI